jgi:hypothetical protein
MVKGECMPGHFLLHRQGKGDDRWYKQKMRVMTDLVDGEFADSWEVA